MANKKGGPKESKTKATSKLRSASPSSRYGLSETDLDQMGESTDSSGPRSATSSPAESEKGSEGAIVSADVDSSPIGEDYLKLEKAGRSAASVTQLRGTGAAGTPASAESAASSTAQEGTFELSELKVLLAELTQDIKKSEKANEKATAKALERLKQELKQEMKQANECLRQEIQQANERLRQEFQQANERLRQEVQLELRQVLGKIEERIEKNSAKLSTLADQLEHLSETFTNRIEIAEHLAASAEERAVNVSSECKKLGEKLGDRLAALEDGNRRYNVRIEGLPENRESLNPVKFATELFSKIIGGDFKAESEIAAAYRVRGSNTVRPRPRSFIVRFERLSFKLEVMELLRKKKEDIKYEDCQIRVFPDFSPATAIKRAAFYNIKQRLRQANVKYGLLYPAKLKVEWQGHFYVFASKEEAENELRKLIPGLF